VTFGHPILLLTLLALPAAVGVYVLLERRRMRYAVTFTNLDVLASVAGGRSPRRYVAPAVFLLALAALCVALARPQRATQVPSNRATVILVIDVSGSMQATDVKPTRLRAAQAAAKRFLDEVPAGIRIGLIAFSGDAEVASLPTTDRDALGLSLDELTYFRGFGGTAIGDALKAAVELGQQAVPTQNGTAQTIANVTPKSLVSILFLSDGKQTRGALQPLDGAQLARAAGIPVYTIALGTPNGRLERWFGGGLFGGTPPPGAGFGIPVPPDPATLRAIARVTGGKFFAARSADALRSAYTDLGHKLGRVPGKREVTNEFVGLAAVLLLAAGVLAALWAPRLP
jgi:Ca-activated chloride channel family protein